MHTLPSSWLPLLLTLPLAISSAQADEVWVVTDARHPVNGASAADRVITLDAAQRIEAELSAHLPSDPQRAAMLVRQRLQQGGTALQQRLRMAYQDLVDAQHLGITRLPAVVVDRRYVVYGEHNLDHALVRIEQYRGNQP